MANYESSSLIDWSGPVAECLNKPLILLPSLNNPIDVGEDNPFDAVERQITENEPLDIFNLNLSSNDNHVSSCEHSDSNSSFSEIKVVGCENAPLRRDDTASGNEDIADDALNIFSKQDEKDVSYIDPSLINSLSSLSDLKEIVSSRILRCLNRAGSQFLNSSSDVKSSTSQLSPTSAKTTFSFSPTKLMNECFIKTTMNSENIKLDDAELFDNVDVEYEDLLSLKPNWNEYLLSSSDDEVENPKLIADFVEKLKLASPVKKTTLENIRRMKNPRAPLICKDPNIRIKKTDSTSKPGPLKAVVPITKMKKQNARKSVSTSARVTTSSKSKVSSTNQTKLKRWSSPIATSTPQSLKTSKQLPVANSARNPSLQKQPASKVAPHPPSPDSTSDCKMFSKIGSFPRLQLRSYLNRSSDAVSSSTNNNSSKMPLRTSKNLKNHSFPDSDTKMVGAKSYVKNVRNKENLTPFKN